VAVSSKYRTQFLKQILKQIRKYTIWLILFIVVLILLLTGFSYTSAFKKILNRKITQLVTNNTNFSLSVEKIEGNVFRRVRLMNVTVEKDDTLIISISRVNAEYTLRSLMERTISLDSLVILSPSVYPVQYMDSTWNLQYLFKSKPEDRPRKPFDYAVEINTILILNGNAEVKPLNAIIPQELADLQLLSTGKYMNGQLEFELYDMSFRTRTPSLNAHSVKCKFKKDSSGIYLNDLLLSSAGSYISSDAYYKTGDTLHARIIAETVDKDELMGFFPGLNLLRSPGIKATINSGRKSTDVWVDVEDDNQSLKSETTFPPLKAMFNSKRISLPFHSKLSVTEFIPEQWIILPETKIVSNGKLELEGANLLSPRSGLKLNAVLNNLTYDGNKFDSLLLEGTFKQSRIIAELDVLSGSLDAGFMAEVSNIFSVPEYSLLSDIEYLDPSLFTDDLKGTSVRANFQARGRYFDQPGPFANGVLELKESSVNHVPLESGLIYWNLENRILRLDSLYIILDGGSMKGNGEYNIASREFISSFQTHWDSTTSFIDSLDLPFEFGSLNTNTELSGKPDDISFSGIAHFYGIKASSIFLKELKPTVEGRIMGDSLSGIVDLKGYNLDAFSVSSDSIHANARFSKDSISASILAFINDSTNTSWDGQISLGDSIRIGTESMYLNTAYSEYFVESALVTVILNKNYIYFPELWIRDRLNPDFELRIQGHLSGKEENGFSLIAESLDAKRLNRLLQFEDSISGLFNTELMISGSLENLVANGHISAVNPGFGNLSVTELSGQLDYSEKQLKADVKIPEFGEGAIVSSTIPIIYRQDSAGFFIDPVDTFFAEVRIDSLSIEQIFNSGQSSDLDIKGFLNTEIQATGSFTNPMFYGNINLYDLYVYDYVQGVSLERINAGISLAGNSINIENLDIDQKSGYLKLNGGMEFDSSIIKAKVRDASLIANAKDFTFNTKSGFNLKMDADAYLKSGSGKPEFGGEIRIIQSSINLDELAAGRDQGEDEEDIPLLVQAVYGEQEISNQVVVDTLMDDELSEWERRFLDNITGRLKVIIPHNTWLKNENMNLELNGELDLVKVDPVLEIFGEIDISRGYYIIYGKRLSIREGKIIFKGGEKIDPDIQLLGELTFRDENRSSRTLDVSVTGNLLDPEIEFFLDEKSIPETEAMYILVFGKTAEEIERAGQGSMVTSFGAGQLSHLITSQLNRTLGSTLNLDYIEVSSSDNWQSASFVVGTYITNDLFVTYQRGFGETEGDEITPSEVALEYRLNQLLFMRLKSGTSKTSGLDAILKFEEKKKKKN